MKRFLCCFIWLFLLFAPALAQNNNQEFRAIWLVDHQWLSPDNSVEENKARIREILDNLKRANFTSVLWQVRRFGSVYYPSALEPWGPQVNFTDPGFDPLAFAIQEAHARGLELHAWFNTFESRFAYAGSPSQQNPDWICRDQDGNTMPAEIAWLSPGLEEVRDYLKKVAMEIVRNYDIDGLHLDFVRWNEHTNSSTSLTLAKQNLERQLPDGMITEAQLNELQTNASGRYLYDVEHPFSAGVPKGFASWEDWWRASVTDFVQALHDSIQAVKPWVRLSPAALGRYNWGGWQGYDIVYQDAALWLNEGYIDQLIGMHYHWSLPDEFVSVLVSGCPQCWSQFIQPAIQAQRLYTVGLYSDNFSEDKIFGRHKPIIDRVRDISWVDGFQFFSYGSWRDQQYWGQAKELFFNQKAKIRATRLIDDVAPDAPAMTLNKIDSLNYEITVTPAATINANQWFAIYRSPDVSLQVDQDEIVDIHFGDSEYALVDSFDGLQDFNGTYYYFATTLDRYWNESLISNTAESDSIPSFAPTIIATAPADGDTIPVHTNIEITFSKTMDRTLFQNAISLSPQVQIGELVWSADDKTVTIKIDGLFDFATDYTLTINPSATDVNGKALDGNGDGFELNFRTLPEDKIGPHVVFSFPTLQGTEEAFKIDGVITFQFDEIVDENSASENVISLKQGQTDIAIGHSFTTVNNQSVLSIQPLQPLENSQDYTLTLAKTITDTLGNEMAEDVSVSFRTSPERYSEVILIDQFLSTTNWFQPNQSGSTMGIVIPNTTFEMSTDAYLPYVNPRQRISPRLKYEWDDAASEFLIRVYLSTGAPRDVLFDTTYVLQCYVFGDGSNNKFRFAADDKVPATAAENHEVSSWVTINWVGWRIIEWDLGDPNSVGIWIGDGVPEGVLRFDSFQFTHDSGDATTGQIFFDNLRLVKKTTMPVGVTENRPERPKNFQLYQNYPNPFNPSTAIEFDLPENGNVKLTIYDVLGREVKILADQRMTAGNYKIQFDASGLASGVYLYRLSINDKTITRRMLFMK